MTLEGLGSRVVVMGPSNSGKSTLAAAIGAARHLPVVHLDQLHHLPGTDWVARDKAEFVALHDAAIAGERWVMDGNYSACLPQRLRRATGLILLDVGTATSLFRYLRRTLFETHRRIGGLDRGRDRVKWEMIRYIATVTRAHRRRYARDFDALALPALRLPSPRALRGFYAAEELVRFPAPGARNHAPALTATPTSTP